MEKHKSQLVKDAEGNDYPRELLESPYSSFKPFYRFLTHKNDKEIEYDGRSKGFDKEMFDRILASMP